MIGLMTYYGIKMYGQGRLENLRWMLIGFVNYAFVCCVLLGGLEGVEVERREIERTGWYGQISVLLLLTCLLTAVSSLVFAFQTSKLISSEYEKEEDKDQGFVSMEMAQPSAESTPPSASV